MLPTDIDDFLRAGYARYLKQKEKVPDKQNMVLRGGCMNEKSLTVLEQYEINLKEIFRTKGNYGCVTEKDIYILQEYNDGEKKGGTHNLIGTYL